ncbi:predicted protein [Uncinocarpus reesii 1704]|uniref:Inner kinetochore subunit AME1 domain-containing protein n=1 Tax=Uncinocarpus reesii (strain UAMH 1704) TaxID=336963 RepID=C4JFB3_UNCRE|nr:uncharacterized protein UREG_02335 [Uncinocarpus reesii 1704]EEP77486.1 predicted protein [Uncinocarpus reesii 1704]
MLHTPRIEACSQNVDRSSSIEFCQECCRSPPLMHVLKGSFTTTRVWRVKKGVVATIKMSVATNRAERQQMRQRGAANRKVKDVDFGFSFGSPQVLPKQPAQASSLSPPNREPTQVSPPKASTPNKKLSRPSTPGSRRLSARRTSNTPISKAPRSSGNQIPSPASVYDIPLDDEPEQRSSKRRRIKAIHEHQEEPLLPTAPSVLDHASPNLLQSDEQRPNEVQLPSVVLSPAQNPQRITLAAHHDGLSKEDFQKQHANPSPRKRKKRKSVRILPKKQQKPRIRANVEEPREVLETEEPVATFIGQRQLSEPRSKSKISPRAHLSPRENPTGVQPEVGGTYSQQEEKENDASTNFELPNVENVEQGELENDDDLQAGAKQKRPRTKSARQAETGGQKNKRRKPAINEVTNEETVSPNRVESEVLQPEQPETTQLEKPRPSRRNRRRAASKSLGDASEEVRGSSRSTIPVTVHRLCNISALENVSEGSDISDTEQAVPDKAQSRQKHSTRGGINAADVLNQICQETLEKTLSTLQKNIEQESNVGRASEWKRKCKVVQEFGSELENSLFGISELLESNFVLAARVKREKKEMLSLRHQLISLRKEREDVALRIDDVRSKYADDESARTERDSLNNSLHDLQLALERSHKRAEPSNTSPFAGLEFLLRMVGRNVSSIAPDSQGGLLYQIKHFNSQLENSAALLEK